MLMHSEKMIYIEPYTYISFNSKKILIHNTISNKTAIIKSNPSLCDRLTKLKISNSKIINIETDTSDSRDFRIFINRLRKLFCGDFIINKNKLINPFICDPKVVIEEDRHVFQHDQYSGEFRIECLTEYLHELTLYFDTCCKYECLYCSKAFKQLNCCHKFQGTENRIKKINESLTNQLKNYSIKRISLVLGDFESILSYSQLISNFLDLSLTVRLVCHAKRFTKTGEISDILYNERIWLSIIIDDTIPLNTIFGILENYKKIGTRISFIYLVQTPESFQNLDKIYSSIRNNRVDLYPLLSANNSNFIYNQLRIRKHDLLKTNHSLQELELNKIVNTNFFGKLFIYPNGEVRSSRTGTVLGNVIKDSIKDVISKELKSVQRWRLTRDKVEVCKNCVFKDLCSPISDISFLLNRYDICTLSKNYSED